MFTYCEDCACWAKESGDVGECHARAPVPLSGRLLATQPRRASMKAMRATDGEYAVFWPVTLRRDFCADGRAR